MTARRAPVAVLKFGGEVVAEGARLARVLAAVAELVGEGWRFLLCHGGGPQVSALTRRLGMAPVMVAGRRVTDDATLQVVKQVLGGEVNLDVVAAALAAGLDAVGFAGPSGGTVRAHRRPPAPVAGGGEELVDFGHVGRVERIDTRLIDHLWAAGFTPVMSTLGAGTPAGETCPLFNINADTVASAVAEALGADHLFLMTGVPGVLRDPTDPTTRIPRLAAGEARAAIAAGVIAGGMIPKVDEALRRLGGEGGGGIRAVHILGASADALRGEAADPGSCGTVLVA